MEEEVPIEGLKLFGNRTSLNIRLIERDRLVPEKSCRAVTEIVRVFYYRITRDVTFVKSEDPIGLIVDNSYFVSSLEENNPVHLTCHRISTERKNIVDAKPIEIGLRPIAFLFFRKVNNQDGIDLSLEMLPSNRLPNLGLMEFFLAVPLPVFP